MAHLTRETEPWGQEMSVLGPDDDGHEPWQDQERTPLNSPDKLANGRGGSRGGSPSAQERARREVQLARNEATAVSEAADMRKSKFTSALLGLFCLDPLLDGLLLLELASEDLDTVAVYGQTTRVLARIGQIVATIFTLLLGLYCFSVLRRWQLSAPRFAAAAATQFALLPEYKAISLVLDVGKLAYPSGMRVPLVSLLMVTRTLSVLGLLRLTFAAGARRGLNDAKGMPQMLRTLVSLEGVESRGLGDVAPAAERPLTVNLLEKLIVFFTPRRLGARPREGAGLARNSALPLTTFVFLITLVASGTEYERLFAAQVAPTLTRTLNPNPQP